MNQNSRNEPDLFSFTGTAPIEHTESGPDFENEERIRILIEETGFYQNPRFLLKTEAWFLKLAHAHNKILSLSNSRTRILAHQVSCTCEVVNALNRRFLIADEVGLGKTVEAGLIIKELAYRHEYRKILIVCPASLLYQWQNEMRSKFNEEFVIIDRKEFQSLQKRGRKNDNPWKFHDRVICSLDFIKNEKFFDDLEKMKWDAVIFDEAHRLRRDGARSTQAYRLAEIIAGQTDTLLLLTATPFRGKLEELYFLMRLLDKNILGPFQSFYRDFCISHDNLSILRERISPALIRRTKAEVGGFTKRHASTVRFELYPDERRLYDETTRYVVEEYNRAMEQENRAVGFVMTVFQKLLDSSSHALLSALKKRKARLERLMEQPDTNRLIMKNWALQLEELQNEDEEEMARCWDLTVKKTAAELSLEIKILGRLIRLAEKITCSRKGDQLLELVRSVFDAGYQKIIIFTQFRTTQDYLRELLREYPIALFHGSLSRDEKEAAMARFRSEASILISTEAGGEGRNMQFCSVLVNYDLPWSPLKIEQRIGRVHRFGQVRDVLIYNFSTRDTVAERVLEVLTHKLRLFEESIGSPDVLLGQVEDELRLGNLFMEMAAGLRTGDDVEYEIDERLERARENFERLSELTVSRRMDFNYDEYYRITMKERQFTNQRIENFITNLSRVDQEPSLHIEPVEGCPGIYAIGTDNSRVPRHGAFRSETALENEDLEFLAFGHPVIDRLIDHAGGDNFGGEAGIRQVPFHRSFAAMVFNYIVTFSADAVHRELVPVVVPITDLERWEIEDIERDLLEAPRSGTFGGNVPDCSPVMEGLDAFFQRGRKRLMEKVESRIGDITENLDIRIDPELEKVRSSYDAELGELREKLDLQESQMKWYGRDMKSAISRTRNLIRKTEREYRTVMDRYRGFLGVTFHVTLLNAGIVIGES